MQDKIDEVFARIPPEERIKQIAGKDNIPGEKPKHIETADPMFHFLSRGRVQVIGSAWVDREYASMDHFMRNIGEKVLLNVTEVQTNLELSPLLRAIIPLRIIDFT